MTYEDMTIEEILELNQELQQECDIRFAEIIKLQGEVYEFGGKMNEIDEELEYRAKLVRVAESRIDDDRVGALASDLAALLREATALKEATKDDTVGKVLSTVLFSMEGFELLGDNKWSHSTADCNHSQSIDIGNHRDYIIGLNDLDFFIEDGDRSD